MLNSNAFEKDDFEYLLGENSTELVTIHSGYYYETVTFQVNLVKFKTNEDLKRFLLYGVIVSTCEYVHIKETMDWFSVGVVDSTVNIQIKEKFPYDCVAVMDIIDPTVLNGRRYEVAHPVASLIDVKTGKCFKAQTGIYSFSGIPKPVVAEEKSSRFLESIQQYANEALTLWKEETQVKVEGKSFLGASNPLSKGSVPLAYGLSLDFSMEELNPMESDEESYHTLQLRVRVLSTSWRTFVFLDDITVPTAIQRRGIYTGLCRIIKDFMQQNSLGEDIGCIDSSDGEETTDVAERFGLVCHAFMERDYNLES